MKTAIEQYHEIKRQNPGLVLLFRMGDFYELFYEDAEKAARILGLLIQAGNRMAVCEASS